MYTEKQVRIWDYSHAHTQSCMLDYSHATNTHASKFTHAHTHRLTQLECMWGCVPKLCSLHMHDWACATHRSVYLSWCQPVSFVLWQCSRALFRTLVSPPVWQGRQLGQTCQQYSLSRFHCQHLKHGVYEDRQTCAYTLMDCIYI